MQCLPVCSVYVITNYMLKHKLWQHLQPELTALHLHSQRQNQHLSVFEFLSESLESQTARTDAALQWNLHGEGASCNFSESSIAWSSSSPASKLHLFLWPLLRTLSDVTMNLRLGSMAPNQGSNFIFGDREFAGSSWCDASSPVLATATSLTVRTAIRSLGRSREHKSYHWWCSLTGSDHEKGADDQLKKLEWLNHKRYCLLLLIIILINIIAGTSLCSALSVWSRNSLKFVTALYTEAYRCPGEKCLTSVLGHQSEQGKTKQAWQLDLKKDEVEGHRHY